MTEINKRRGCILMKFSIWNIRCSKPVFYLWILFIYAGQRGNDDEDDDDVVDNNETNMTSTF